MRRLLLAIVLMTVGATVVTVTSSYALSNDPKQFIKADNTFYAYVKGGEKISASFLRAAIEGDGGTKKNVTVTLDGPEVKQQKCTIANNVAVGKGCIFTPQTATVSGIWRIQFIAPSDASPYPEVHPVVRWGKNLFEWNIDVMGSDGEKHGRVWTDRYAIYQPSSAAYSGDFTYYYISEDGYIYKSTELGYNGVASVLSADAIGIRKGDQCESAYRSTEISDTNFSPALGVCGNAYKLFFAEPAGDLPTKTSRWDGQEDWVRPNISRPSLSELHFSADDSPDQQSGTISFFLHNFIGQYEIKIDVDNDGGFDGQSDVTMHQQMKKLSDGLQQVRFAGVDREGQIIPRSQPIGIKVNITKVAEIHLVAADVEGRSGGLELVRLNGENAPTTRMCWNDTELAPLAREVLTTETVDGRDCQSSVDGLHAWSFGTGSWGDRRYIDDWIFASVELQGNNQIVYPEADAEEADAAQSNLPLIILAIVGGIVIIGTVVAVVVLKRRKNKQLPPPQPPTPPSIITTGQDQPPSSSPPMPPQNL